MYVRSLRLAGFKSFANPTILEFEPAVNVIVGPNGSGKSNIADSLAWVLGSQAPSSLRGAAMEDVIFAGSQNRPGLGMAEVELTLDNSSGILPLNVAEVTVSRFTDRSGASEYRINGAACRLLDVTELLSDTGIGRSLHAIVGQGRLDEVLQARPEDRRTFIEEAAQIGKFRKRKDRALKKIERVEDNLMRLNDVLSELRRAIRPLKRQATAAAAYSELMTEHQELKQRLTATELTALASEAATVDVDAEERRRSLLAEEVAGIRARLQTAADEREAMRVSADRARSIAFGMSRAADRLGALGRLAQERAARLAARLAAETEETYRERIRLLEHDLRRWTEEEKRLSETAASARSRAEEAAARAEDAKRDREQAESRLAETRAAETAAAQALVRAEGSESASRATIGSIQARVQAVEERLQVTEQELSQDSESLATSLRESRALEQELDSATERAAEAESRLEAKRERVEALKEQLGSDHAHLAAAEARRRALEEAAALLNDLPEAGARLQPLIEDARDSERLRGAGRQEAAEILASAQDAV
ncbi:MAG: AAA family ATPase, partial [Actinomycetota bacterium]|nr:AAA family ATPase [Actinomycetota bacterium]